MIEYEDTLNWEKVQMLKTVPLEGIYRTTKTKSRKCNTCSEYNKGKCVPVGIIANPNFGYCSWHKGNGNENKRLVIDDIKKKG